MKVAVPPSLNPFRFGRREQPLSVRVPARRTARVRPAVGPRTGGSRLAPERWFGLDRAGGLAPRGQRRPRRSPPLTGRSREVLLAELGGRCAEGVLSRAKRAPQR